MLKISLYNSVVSQFLVLSSGTFFGVFIRHVLSSSVITCCVIIPLCATCDGLLCSTETVARFLFCL